MTEGRRWRLVHGFHNYEVSDFGEIRRADSCLSIRQQIAPSGYATVRLSMFGRAKTMYVHRMVLIAFNSQPAHGLQTRHLDGNKLNNSLSNLCWGTSAENAEDRRRHGTMPIGAKHWNTKVSDEQIVLAIKNAMKSSLIKEAKLIGVSPSTLSMIRRGINRRHLSEMLSKNVGGAA